MALFRPWLIRRPVALVSATRGLRTSAVPGFFDAEDKSRARAVHLAKLFEETRKDARRAHHLGLWLRGMAKHGEKAPEGALTEIIAHSERMSEVSARNRRDSVG